MKGSVTKFSDRGQVTTLYRTSIPRVIRPFSPENFEGFRLDPFAALPFRAGLLRRRFAHHLFQPLPGVSIKNLDAVCLEGFDFDAKVEALVGDNQVSLLCPVVVVIFTNQRDSSIGGKPVP
jgi:hypothetical protein